MFGFYDSQQRKTEFGYRGHMIDKMDSWRLEDLQMDLANPSFCFLGAILSLVNDSASY